MNYLRKTADSAWGLSGRSRFSRRRPREETEYEGIAGSAGEKDWDFRRVLGGNCDHRRGMRSHAAMNHHAQGTIGMRCPNQIMAMGDLDGCRKRNQQNANHPEKEASMHEKAG